MQRALSPVLIGRDREVGVLEDTLLTASRGDARVALIAGEAGMGKTRLAEEVKRRAHKIGFEVLTGGCTEADLALPYLPLVEAVGNYLARADLDSLRERLGPSARELGRLFPRLTAGGAQADVGDPAHARLRICEALTDLLQVPADQHGLLLVLEDLHWADASTREVVDFLVRRLRTGRVMILGTYRTDEMHRKHPLLPTVQGWLRAGLVEIVELNPLTAKGVAEMVRAIFDQEQRISDEFRDFLHSRCEGNPFVLEEMLKVALDSGDIYRSESGWERKDLRELRLPRTVRDTILMRVERLGEANVQLLAAAAVLGQSFDASLLTEASGQPQESVENGLQAAEQQQILEPETGTGRYRFRHALTREVIYEDLPAPKRDRLHLKAADLLRAKGEAHAVDLVNHLMAANAFTEAVPMCIDAARDANRLAAYEESIDLFQRALPHISEPRTRAEVLCELGQASGRAGRADQAIEYLTDGIAALEALGEPIRAAQYRLDYAHAWGLRGSTHREEQELLVVVQILEPEGPSAALARAYMRLSATHSFDYGFEEARQMAEKAIETAEAAGADELRIWSYIYLGGSLVGLGLFDEGLAMIERSYREALAHDLRWIAGNALHNELASLLWRGRPAARQALQLVPQMRDLRVASWSVTSPLIGESMTGYFLGPLEAVETIARKTIEIGTSAGNHWVARFAEITLSLVLVELGRGNEALPFIGITRAERQRDSQEAAAQIRYGLVAADEQRWLEGARFLLGAHEAATGLPWAAEIAIEGLLASNLAADARVMALEFESQPWNAGSPFVLRAQARLALAEGNREAAIESAQSALAAFKEAGYILDSARTLVVLGEAEAQASPGHAGTHLSEALQLADSVGSVAVRRFAVAAAERLGIELPAAERPSPEDRAEMWPGEKLVTVLFADVRGYSALTSALAPAELADRIATFQRWATSEVERRHGVVDKFAGDAMMASFNVSGASLDHCVQALQVALAMRDKASLLGLPIGAGIATGAAVVGNLAQGANLSVLGEATNLAARLQQKAAAGEILLSEQARRRVQDWLNERGIVSEPVSLDLKGIGPTDASRLSAPARVTSG